MPYLQIRRHGDGIGDWLFMLQALKHVNQQAPDISIRISFKLTPKHNRHRELSPLVREAFERSDVKWADALNYKGEPHVIDNTVETVIEHLVYPARSQEPYAKGMLDTLGTVLGREFVYSPECRPVYVYPERPVIYDDSPELGGDYVVMVSQGKAETTHKDWGTANFAMLARRFAEARIPVVQVGAAGERLLSHAIHRLGASFETLASILARARLVIGIENMVPVLARHLGAKTAVIYQRGHNIGRIDADVVAFVTPTPSDVFAWAKEELKC